MKVIHKNISFPIHIHHYVATEDYFLKKKKKKEKEGAWRADSVVKSYQFVLLCRESKHPHKETQNCLQLQLKQVWVCSSPWTLALTCTYSHTHIVTTSHPLLGKVCSHFAHACHPWLVCKGVERGCYGVLKSPQERPTSSSLETKSSRKEWKKQFLRDTFFFFLKCECLFPVIWDWISISDRR